MDYHNIVPSSSLHYWLLDAIYYIMDDNILVALTLAELILSCLV